MAKIKFNIRHFGLAPIFGFGYWKDTYNPSQIGLGGEVHNFVVPLFKIQWGWIVVENELEN